MAYRNVPKKQLRIDHSNQDSIDRTLAHIDENFNLLFDNSPALSNAVGATSRSGTFTANGTSAVTVANTNVGANSQILISLKTVGGTVSTAPPVHVDTITPGTGFTVKGTAADTSVYNYSILG